MTPDQPTVRGLVAFSFALRGPNLEPNPCNQRLAEQVRDIVAHDLGVDVIVAQWEIALALEALDVKIDHIVQPVPGRYLDSEQVWAEAKATFDENNVDEAVLVANPFLHLHKVKSLAKRDKYPVYDVSIDYVGFDSSAENVQWWTRGPARLVAYSLAQAAGLRLASRTA